MSCLPFIYKCFYAEPTSNMIQNELFHLQNISYYTSTLHTNNSCIRYIFVKLHLNRSWEKKKSTMYFSKWFMFYKFFQIHKNYSFIGIMTYELIVSRFFNIETNRRNIAGNLSILLQIVSSYVYTLHWLGYLNKIYET